MKCARHKGVSLHAVLLPPSPSPLLPPPLSPAIALTTTSRLWRAGAVTRASFCMSRLAPVPSWSPSTNVRSHVTPLAVLATTHGSRVRIELPSIKWKRSPKRRLSSSAMGREYFRIWRQGRRTQGHMNDRRRGVGMHHIAHGQPQMSRGWKEDGQTHTREGERLGQWASKKRRVGPRVQLSDTSNGASHQTRRLRYLTAQAGAHHPVEDIRREPRIGD